LFTSGYRLSVLDSVVSVVVVVDVREAESVVPHADSALAGKDQHDGADSNRRGGDHTGGTGAWSVVGILEASALRDNLRRPSITYRCSPVS